MSLLLWEELLSAVQDNCTTCTENQYTEAWPYLIHVNESNSAAPALAFSLETCKRLTSLQQVQEAFTFHSWQALCMSTYNTCKWKVVPAALALLLLGFHTQFLLQPKRLRYHAPPGPLWYFHPGCRQSWVSSLCPCKGKSMAHAFK